MEEIWLPIKGFEDSHEVSNKGGIKSLSRRVRSGTKGFRIIKETILITTTDLNGYKTIKLLAKGKIFKVHRLVALAFIPEVEGKAFVNHINGIKSDNRVENLEWVNRSENHLHAHKMGLQVNKRGSELSFSKPVDVLDLEGNILYKFGSIRLCVKELNLHKRNVEKVLYGKLRTYRNMHFRFA